MHINQTAELNNELKHQQVKTHKWAMINEALEAVVPGMQAVAANPSRDCHYSCENCDDHF
jgi:hypothetical protein